MPPLFKEAFFVDDIYFDNPSEVDRANPPLSTQWMQTEGHIGRSLYISSYNKKKRDHIGLSFKLEIPMNYSASTITNLPKS